MGNALGLLTSGVPVRRGAPASPPSAPVLPNATTYWRAQDYSVPGVLLDPTGHGHYATLGAEAGAFISQDTAGVMCLNLWRVAGNGAATPSTSVNVTGDLDARVLVALPTYAPSSEAILVQKTDGSGTGACWRFQIRATSGQLRLRYYDGVTNRTADSTHSLAIAAGTKIWLRATIDVDNGAGGHTIRFYQSVNGVAWTQVGNPVTVAGVISLFANSSPVSVGSFSAEGHIEGKIYRAQYLDGIDGTLLFDADFSTATSGATSIIDSVAGLTMTVTNSPANGADDPLSLTYAGSQYGYFPGVVGNCAVGNYSGFAGKNSGTVTLIVRLRSVTYQGASTWLGAANGCFSIGADSSGRPLATIKDSTGTARTVVAEFGITLASVATNNVTDAWVRAVYSFATNQVTFSYSLQDTNDYEGLTWNALGTPRTVTSFNGTLDASFTSVVAGHQDAGVTGPYSGRIYRAVWLNDGVAVADANFTDTSRVAAPFTAFADAQGNAWSLNRSATNLKLAVVNRPAFLFSTNDYLHTPDNSRLDFGAVDAFSLSCAFQVHGTPAAAQVLAAKKAGLATGAGYALYLDTSRRVVGVISEGVNSVTITSGVIAEGVAHTATLVRDPVLDEVRLYVDSVAVTPVVDMTAGSLINSEALRTGRLSGSGTSYLEGLWFGTALFSRVITPDEHEQLRTELRG